MGTVYFTPILQATNKKGKVFCLAVDDNQKYTVYALCENYDGQVRGGIRKTWRYVEKDMTIEDAKKLFKRRVSR